MTVRTAQRRSREAWLVPERAYRLRLVKMGPWFAFIYNAAIGLILITPPRARPAAAFADLQVFIQSWLVSLWADYHTAHHRNLAALAACPPSVQHAARSFTWAPF